MDVVTAHGLIAARTDEGHSLMPPDVEVSAVEGLDPVPALVTAGAMLSGQLGDARSEADVVEAFGHFRSLLNAGVVSADEWSIEAENVIGEIITWGNAAEHN